MMLLTCALVPCAHEHVNGHVVGGRFGGGALNFFGGTAFGLGGTALGVSSAQFRGSGTAFGLGGTAFRISNCGGGALFRGFGGCVGNLDFPHQVRDPTFVAAKVLVVLLESLEFCLEFCAFGDDTLVLDLGKVLCDNFRLP